MSDSYFVSLAGQRCALDLDRELWVGRGGDADIQSDDERVSRRHAVIRRVADGWVFEDHSTNGSFVGERRVANIALVPGTRVRLANPVDGPLLEVVSTNEGPARAPEPIALGERTGIHALATTIRIGRAPDNDIVLDDLTVSRQHAVVRRVDQTRYDVTDVGSHNGTYLNGVRITSGVLERGGVLAIGKHIFTPGLRGLEEYVDIGRVRLQVADLAVDVGDRRLLDGVSFALDESALMAIVGPTGAGKSTLLNALMGSRRVVRGRVLYGGRDLFANFDELRRRIGFVPQDDILHVQLSAQRALGYAAELRFPPDTTVTERGARIAEVLVELGLQDRADLPIHKLSGGQRKRTSVALELLTRPSLVLLDEPTSGLDPGYERVLMTLLKDLARSGRTVLVVTHSLQSLDLCDRVLFLAPGGRSAFFGPPNDALRYFGHTDYVSIFGELEHRRDIDWKARFQSSSFYDTNVRRRLGASAEAANRVWSAEPSVQWLRQVNVLVRRYVAVLQGDTRNFLLLLLQAPLLGLLMLAAMPEGGLERRSVPNTDAHTVLMTLMISGTFLGASNAIREIVKERAIFRRERSIGLSPSAYVVSKAVVLATLTILQAFVLVCLALLRQNQSGEGLVFQSIPLELSIAVALTGLAAMAVGLIVSAYVRNADLALTMLPLVLLTELILSGALFVLGDKPVLREASYVSGSRWGFAMTAATTDLRLLEAQRCRDGTKNRLECEASADSTARAWSDDALMLVGLSSVGLIGAWISVRRMTPG